MIHAFYNRFFMMITLALIVSGCSMSQPTYLNQTKVTVKQDVRNNKFETKDVDNDVLDALVYDYKYNGEGPVELTVTYDSQLDGNTALFAGGEAGRMAKYLREKGVEEVDVAILPVKRGYASSKTSVIYNVYEAKAPENCTDLPGLNDDNLYVDDEYKLGCGRDSTIIKQIARPKDLLGNSGLDYVTDGRRSAVVVERYRDARQNEPLEGESSTGE